MGLDRSNLASMVRRFGLGATGVICWKGATTLWTAGAAPQHAGLALLMVFGYAAGLGLLVLAAADVRRRTAEWSIAAGLAFVCVTYAIAQRIAETEAGTLLTTDAYLYTDYAARLLRAGENPYGHEMVEAFRVYRAPLNYMTPLIDGNLSSRFAYPALHLLLFVPVQLVGLDTSLIYPVVGLATLTMLYLGVRAELRPVILLPFFADQTYLHHVLGGVTDITWALLLLAMLRSWHQPKQRGLWFGLACAYKHQPWALAPFLLIRIWHESSGQRPAQIRELLRFTGWSVGAFVAVNLPFFVWNPGAWLAGVTEPLVTPMITLGQGLSSLSMLGLAVMPKYVYSLFMVAVLGVCLGVYWRHFHRMRALLWLAPPMVLFFSNRSLNSYWYFAVIPLLYDLFGGTSTPATAREDSPDRNWRPAALAVGVLLAAIVVTVSAFALRSPRIDVTLETPMTTRGTRVMGMSVWIRNRSDSELAPRISVQSGGDQPFFWRIDEGPLTLKPGADARYRITASWPFAEFDLRRGARVNVTDAGRYGLRTTAVVRGEPDFMRADGIPNGQFRYWNEAGTQPRFWGPIVEPNGMGRVAALQPKEQGAPATGLRFTLDESPDNQPRRALLDTYLPFPEAGIEVMVRPPDGANLLPELSLIYGLQVTFSGASLWVLFGDEQAHGQLSDGTRYWMLPAPRQQWSSHQLDLRAICEKLDLSLGTVRASMPRFERLDFPITPTNLDLILAARSYPDAVKADFGPVRSMARRPPPDRLTRRALDHPTELLVWLGDLNLEMRNYEVAAERFQRALASEPSSGPASYGLGEAQLKAGNLDKALAGYQQAVELGYRLPLAHKGVGWTLHRLGRHEEALAALDRCIELLDAEAALDSRGHKADALLGASLALVALGRCPDATARYGRARHLQPNQPWPKGWFTPCKDKMGDD